MRAPTGLDIPLEPFFASAGNLSGLEGIYLFCLLISLKDQIRAGFRADFSVKVQGGFI